MMFDPEVEQPQSDKERIAELEARIDDLVQGLIKAGETVNEAVKNPDAVYWKHSDEKDKRIAELERERDELKAESDRYFEEREDAATAAARNRERAKRAEHERDVLRDATAELKSTIGLMLRAAQQDEYTHLGKCPEVIRGRVIWLQQQADKYRKWHEDQLAATKKAERERDELKAEVKRLRAVLAHDQSHPLRDVLVLLSGAAHHLLHDHNCDQHGYEEIGEVMDEARMLVQRIDALKGGK
jgi:chromosome segregation ATPase